MDTNSNEFVILSESKQKDYDLYPVLIAFEEDLEKLNISDYPYDCQANQDDEDKLDDIEVDEDDDLKEDIIEVINDPVNQEEIEMMAALGLPTTFKSSKRPFYKDDDDEVDDGCSSPPDEETTKDKRFKKKNQRKKKKSLSKYWHQRYRLFSRFDEGIRLDREAWYSVTPERIAQHIATRCVKPGFQVIMDPFCGVGGNIIQFALASESIFVFASDIDPKKVEMARHNASVYGVQDRIDFAVGDFFQIVKNIKFHVDCIFLSPPWGGPDYLSQEKYSLSMMTPNGFDIYRKAKEYVSPNIALLLPRNVDKDELNSLLEPDEKVEIEGNFLNKKPKTITAYFGDLIVT